MATSTFRTSALSPAIPPRVQSGGFALFANGAGSAQFDNFVVNSVPVPALSLAALPTMNSSLANWTANVPTNTTLAVQTSVDGGNTWSSVSGPGSAIAGITTQFYTSLVKQKQPLGYYQLTELTGTSATDSSIFGQTGAYHGGYTQGVAGPLAGPGEAQLTATNFDGLSGYVSLPTALNGNGWATVSIECWCNLSKTALGTTTTLVGGDATPTNNQGYQLYWQGNTALKWTVGNGTTSAVATLTTAAVAGVWWHVVGTYDGTTLRLYVNGVLQATASLSGTVVAAATPVIGTNTGLASFFPGALSQVSIYNQVLSASDVALRYNAGVSTLLQLYQRLVTSRTPTAYYQMTEQSGTVGRDTTGAFPATITGGVTLGVPGPLQGASQTQLPAMAFDGSTGYLATSLFPSGWTVLSVECWFYLPVLPTTTNPRLVANCHADADNSAGFEVAVAGTSPGTFPAGSAGTLGVAVGTGTARGVVSSPLPILPGTWNYVAATWDGATLSLYQNGALIASTPFSGVIGNCTFPVNIGRNPSYNGDYVAGSIGQVAIYQTTVLSASDINGHYQAGIGAASQTLLDTFVSNSSASYTQGNYGGGANGTWTWDTTNKRLIGQTGTNGTLTATGITSLSCQVLCDLDQADGSGLTTNLTTNLAGAASLYYVQVWDSLAGSNQQSVKLFRNSAGTVTQLGSTIPIAFVRGTYHHLTLDVNAGVLTVSFDGAQLLQQTDPTPLLAGGAGLLLNALLRVYTFQLAQYPLSIGATSVVNTMTLTTSDPTVTPQVVSHTLAVFGPKVDVGTIIPSADYRDTLLSANADDLAKQSNISWYVDQNAAVNFKQRQAIPAPWLLQSTSNALPTDVEIDSNLEVDISGDLYRNRQTITNAGNTVSGAFNTFTGDRFRRDFTLQFKIAPGTTPTVKRNGLLQTVGVKGSSGFQWYYKEKEQSISQDHGQSILGTGEQLSVAYTGFFTSTVTIDNVAAQKALAAQSIGTTGIVEQVTDGHDIPSSAAIQLAQQLLNFYSVVGRTIAFRTFRNGLQVGQVLAVFIPEENLLGARMYITQIDVTMRTQPGNTILYEYIVQATELPNIGSWQKLLASGLLN